MKNELEMDFSVDKPNNMIKVRREFAASNQNVWSAWTQSRLLDQWWAPKPWKAKTKKFDFSVGGLWLYSMTGPKGEEHWSRVDYKSITPQKNFSCYDAFCDSDGNITNTFPPSQWNVDFSEASGITTVEVLIRHENASDLETILEMGFKEGFTMGLNNLEKLLAQI